MQETKLADADAPLDLPRSPATSWPPRRGPLERRRHRQPRRRSTGRGHQLRRGPSATAAPARPMCVGDDDDPLAEARMIGARRRRRPRRRALYAPNGRVVGSPFYEAKLAWFDRLAPLAGRDAVDAGRAAACSAATSTSRPPTIDVWDPPRVPRRHARLASRSGRRFARLLDVGPASTRYRPHHPEPGRYTWWDYRAGNFHKNFGMRIDHLLCPRRSPSASCGPRSTARRARASRSRPTTRRCHRPRRAGRAARCRLGRRAGADRRPDAAAADLSVGRHRFEIRIAVPIDQVFDLYTNPERMHEWTGGVTGVADVSGPVATGRHPRTYCLAECAVPLRSLPRNGHDYLRRASVTASCAVRARPRSWPTEATLRG